MADQNIKQDTFKCTNGQIKFILMADYSILHSVSIVDTTGQKKKSVLTREVSLFQRSICIVLGPQKLSKKCPKRFHCTPMKVTTTLDPETCTASPSSKVHIHTTYTHNCVPNPLLDYLAWYMSQQNAGSPYKPHTTVVVLEAWSHEHACTHNFTSTSSVECIGCMDANHSTKCNLYLLCFTHSVTFHSQNSNS